MDVGLLRSLSEISPKVILEGSSKAEVDFLVSDGMEVFPLECKAGFTMNAKSLKSYKAKYAPSWCLRSSLLPYERNTEARMLNIPLYILFVLDKEINTSRCI
jgi:uncharacterized protein